LAGESAAEDIDWGDICRVELTHVGVAGDSGPVAGKDTLAELIGFALPDDAHPGPLKAEVESTDSREQRADIHALSLLAESRPRAVSCVLGRRAWPVSAASLDSPQVSSGSPKPLGEAPRFTLTRLPLEPHDVSSFEVFVYC
jgi:hypothetical protein